MSFLVDTDLLSLLERKRVPPRLAAWIQDNEADIFLSVVSFAELHSSGWTGRRPRTRPAWRPGWPISDGSSPRPPKN